MSSATPEATPAPVSRDSGNGPGRLIRAARDRTGMTLDVLATQTRLARATLDALERDDYATLNEPVYIKGYYRKCAKVLGLDEAELIGAYERQAGPRQPQAPTKLLLAQDRGLAKPSRGTGGGGLMWLWVMVFAAALGAGVYFLRGESGGASTPATGSTAASHTALSPVPATAPAGSDRNRETGTSPAPLTTPVAPTGTGTMPSPAEAETSTPAAATPGTTPATTAAATPPAAAREGSLALTFKGTSWVRIEDADGKLLLSGVIQAGDHQSVNGRPPYSVFLGNAPGVSVDYNGRPFDVVPYTKTNATARFSVPSS